MRWPCGGLTFTAVAVLFTCFAATCFPAPAEPDTSKEAALELTSPPGADLPEEGSSPKKYTFASARMLSEFLTSQPTPSRRRAMIEQRLAIPAGRLYRYEILDAALEEIDWQWHAGSFAQEIRESQEKDDKRDGKGDKQDGTKIVEAFRLWVLQKLKNLDAWQRAHTQTQLEKQARRRWCKRLKGIGTTIDAISRQNWASQFADPEELKKLAKDLDDQALAVEISFEEDASKDTATPKVGLDKTSSESVLKALKCATTGVEAFLKYTRPGSPWGVWDPEWRHDLLVKLYRGNTDRQREAFAEYVSARDAMGETLGAIAREPGGRSTPGQEKKLAGQRAALDAAAKILTAEPPLATSRPDDYGYVCFAGVCSGDYLLAVYDVSEDGGPAILLRRIPIKGLRKGERVRIDPLNLAERAGERTAPRTEEVDADTENTSTTLSRTTLEDWLGTAPLSVLVPKDRLDAATLRAGAIRAGSEGTQAAYLLRVPFKVPEHNPDKKRYTEDMDLSLTLTDWTSAKMPDALAPVERHYLESSLVLKPPPGALDVRNREMVGGGWGLTFGASPAGNAPAYLAGVSYRLIPEVDVFAGPIFWTETRDLHNGTTQDVDHTQFSFGISVDVSNLLFR